MSNSVQSAGGERRYHMAKEPTRTRQVSAIVTVALLVLLAFAVWYLARNAIIVAKVVFVLIAFFLARLVVLTGLRVFRSNPFLVLDDEGVWFGGWWPANDPGNWKRKVLWSEIAYARAFEEGTGPGSLTLQLYGEKEPDQVLADLHRVDGLANTQDMLRVIAERTGTPVLREAPPSGEDEA